jgi:hypothetical protein
VGSNHALSNGREPQEWTELLQAFQDTNQVIITVSIVLAQNKGKPDLLMQAVAQNNHVNPVVRARWGSVHCQLWGSEWVRWTGALSTLLYRLDFIIGEAEMLAIGVKKA